MMDITEDMPEPDMSAMAEIRLMELEQIHQARVDVGCKFVAVSVPKNCRCQVCTHLRSVR